MKRSGTKLGQNFLVDESASLRIAEALGELAGRTVVEIGPGHGAITEHLAARSGRLHCIELDPALARELQVRFRNNARVTVHQGDILKTDLQLLVAGDRAGHEEAVDVVGNLPYYITSEILLQLFASARDGLLRRAVVMVQREVADRIAATPGSRDYGALSALTRLHASVVPLFTLPPEAFQPPPEVFSTVLRIDFAPRFAELGIPFEAFNQFLRSTFAQKRKTLANNLRAGGFSAAELASAWPASLPSQVRAEAVSIEQLAVLYRSLVSPAAPD